MSYLLVYALGWASCKAWEYKDKALATFKAGWRDGYES